MRALHASLRVIDGLEAHLARPLNVWDRAVLHSLLYALFPAGPQVMDDLTEVLTQLEAFARSRTDARTWTRQLMSRPLSDENLAILARIIEQPHLWDRLQTATEGREEREYLMTQLQRLEAAHPVAVARGALILLDLKRPSAAIRLLLARPQDQPLVQAVLAQAYVANGQPEKVLAMHGPSGFQA